MTVSLQTPYRDLQTYCMFVGYSRSGHTLIGSLLDAHEHAVIAHELDALRFVEAGVPRDELFTALLKQSAAFTKGGRAWSGYQYLVPGQWHSRASQLKVIGDKKGGLSTLRLYQKPELLTRLREVVEIPVRMVHVVRNPWDVIATSYKRRPDANRPISEFTNEFFTSCRTNDVLRYEAAQGELLDTWHEDFIADTHTALARLLDFFGLEGDQDYYDACASIVYAKAHASRFEIEWPAGEIERIAAAAQEYDFLRRYQFAQ